MLMRMLITLLPLLLLLRRLLLLLLLLIPPHHHHHHHHRYVTSTSTAPFASTFTFSSTTTTATITTSATSCSCSCSCSCCCCGYCHCYTAAVTATATATSATATTTRPAVTTIATRTSTTVLLKRSIRSCHQYWLLPHPTITCATGTTTCNRRAKAKIEKKSTSPYITSIISIMTSLAAKVSVLVIRWMQGTRKQKFKNQENIRRTESSQSQTSPRLPECQCQNPCHSSGLELRLLRAAMPRQRGDSAPQRVGFIGLGA